MKHTWNDEGDTCIKCGDKDWMQPTDCVVDRTKDHVTPLRQMAQTARVVAGKGVAMLINPDEIDQAADHIEWLEKELKDACRDNRGLVERFVWDGE